MSQSKILVPAQYFRSGFAYSGDSLWDFEGTDAIIPRNFAEENPLGAFDFPDADTIAEAAAIEDESVWETDASDALMPINTVTTLVSNMTAEMASEQTTFELYKALSVDDYEYARITDDMKFTFPYIPTGKTWGLYIKMEKFLEDADNYWDIGIADESSYTEYDRQDAVTLYGDGTILGGLIRSGVGGEIEGITQTFAELTDLEDGYFYIRHQCLPQRSPAVRCYNLVYGMIYDLPDGQQLEGRTFTYEYPDSTGFTKLLGGVTHSGYSNNGPKRATTLSWKYLTEAQKDELIEMFKLGRGGLPVMYFPDTADKTTWMYCVMKTLTLEETHTKYYTISIDLQEV